MHELFELNLHLDHFFQPSSLLQLHEQLQASVSIQKRVSLVQQFLVSKLQSHKTDMMMLNAVEKIKSVNGAISVKQLAQSFQMSLDPFEKRFRKVIGATPKQFGNIIRMKALIERKKSQDLLVNTALEAGFFDQSHFIRTFKKFTGKTPKHFFSSNEGITSVD